jgi:hypothetical protein
MLGALFPGGSACCHNFMGSLFDSDVVPMELFRWRPLRWSFHSHLH